MNMVCAQGSPNSLIRHIQENPAYAVHLIDLLHQVIQADHGVERLTFTYALVPHDLIAQARSALDVPQVTDYLCAKGTAQANPAEAPCF